MSITTDRDVFIGAHLTLEQKVAFRAEADRRKISMSALLAEIVNEWLIIAPQEQIEEKRSNKRTVKKEDPERPKPQDVPLPFTD